MHDKIQQQELIIAQLFLDVKKHLKGNMCCLCEDNFEQVGYNMT